MKKIVNAIFCIVLALVIGMSFNVTQIYAKVTLLQPGEVADPHPVATKKGIILYDAPKTMYCKALSDNNKRNVYVDACKNNGSGGTYSGYFLIDGQRVKVLGYVEGTSYLYIKYNHYFQLGNSLSIGYWEYVTGFCKSNILEEKRSKKSVSFVNHIMNDSFYKRNGMTFNTVEEFMSWPYANRKINETTYELKNIYIKKTSSVEVIQNDDGYNLHFVLKGNINELYYYREGDKKKNGMNRYTTLKLNKDKKIQTVDINIGKNSKNDFGVYHFLLDFDNAEEGGMGITLEFEYIWS